jgi:hypothetical protein
MGIPAPLGVSGIGDPPARDQANAVISQVFAAVGPGVPFALQGPFNAVIYASYNSALTTTNGSGAASVVAGGAVAAGASINSVNVPPGTTWATFAGAAGTLAFPSVTLRGQTNTSEAFIRRLHSTAGLLGATVTGPGIPANTTVTAIMTPALPPVPASGFAGTSGTVQISNVPTSAPVLDDQRSTFTFALTNQAVTTGVDNAAAITGAGIVYTGSIQLERSFDGGSTWIVCNVGGSGLLAQYSAGTPVSFTAGDPEKGVLYRWNCTSYSSISGVTINTRLSTTGGAAVSLAIASAI